MERGVQILEQLDDLRLDRDVERGGRLVGDQHVGLAQQRHGDHDALAHAAAELMRIGGQPRCRHRGCRHGSSIAAARSRNCRRLRSGWRLRCASTSCVPSVNTGLSAVIGSWKIMAMRVPRSRCMSSGASARRSCAIQRDAARDTAGVFGQQAEQRQRERRLAAAAFADDADDAPLADRKIDVAQRMHSAVRRSEVDRQALDLDQTVRHGSRLSLGSIASRSASPNSVKPSVASVSMPPATSTGQIDCSR